ncbi:hypothetical protein F0562_027817 [Nyssa sinensis]|uniref:C2H2-type domain-containing protein n=1 Tax=Nyssa sinensis TaxID=561372 RepID=A0A5J5B734_9ASTE|nr:hypothetical protein F0562_027817 [Nyssa sinensis]
MSFWLWKIGDNVGGFCLFRLTSGFLFVAPLSFVSALRLSVSPQAHDFLRQKVQIFFVSPSSSQLQLSILITNSRFSLCYSFSLITRHSRHSRHPQAHNPQAHKVKQVTLVTLKIEAVKQISLGSCPPENTPTEVEQNQIASTKCLKILLGCLYLKYDWFKSSFCVHICCLFWLFHPIVMQGYCPSRSTVSKFCAEFVYFEFIKQCNIGVYFSLSFQEIAGALDSALMVTVLVPIQGNSQDLTLKQSVSLLECLRSCWKDDVLVLSCSDKFLRLSLQLLSRYTHWLSAELTACKAAELGAKKYSSNAEMYNGLEKKNIFECTTCNKTFHSCQALRGHRASHKKIKGCFASKIDSSENSTEIVSPDPIADS